MHGIGGRPLFERECIVDVIDRVRVVGTVEEEEGGSKADQIFHTISPLNSEK
jgi:hypothetical protein